MMSAAMKMLKNLLFAMVLLVGCSLVAFGQSNDDKKNPPPKDNPPTVKIGDKNNDKPKDSPKTDSDKPKKPNRELSGELQVVTTK
jgi:hypothetical protein